MPISLVQRLRFDATRCEATFSKGVALNIEEAAGRIEQLEAALADAASGLYNGFEPDNQSAVYKRTIAALNHQSD